MRRGGSVRSLPAIMLDDVHRADGDRLALLDSAARELDGAVVPRAGRPSGRGHAGADGPLADAFASDPSAAGQA